MTANSRSVLILMLAVLLPACSALTLEEEARIGAEQVAQVARQVPIVQDAEVQEYVEVLLQRLLEAAPPSPYEIRIRVIGSEGFNAFAMAGGNIYLTSGVILGSRNAAELVSIMAHELGHIALGHVGQNYRRHRLSQATAELTGITIALATGNPFLAGAGDIAANLGSTVYIASNTRQAEREADEYAYEVMEQAGFDPRAQLTVLTRIQIASQEADSSAPFLLTHPLPVDRITAARSRLDSLSGARQYQVNDNGTLERIQSRLAGAGSN